MTDETGILRLYGTVDDSIVDGPGIRFAVFTQGCRHHCPACHNPEAQSYEGGTLESVEELMVQVRANPLLTGVTLTGGEPFDQAEPLLAFTHQVHELGKTVWAYSGYTFEELEGSAAPPMARELLRACDVLVDGPFIEAQRSLDLRWRGSANQRILDIPATLEAGKIVEWAP
jgi:anaerobic ribonucleoside-triphosphate reductase activating protein